MSANRHLGRIIVLQTLYEKALRESCGDKNVDLDKILNRNIDRYKENVDDTEFVRKTAKGVVKEEEELDKTLQPIAPDWPLDQISRVDHMVLRVGAYELIHHKDVPPKVVINEAVELAKGFGGDSSSRFVNGVLGTLLRQIDPSAESNKEKPKEKKPIKKKEEDK